MGWNLYRLPLLLTAFCCGHYVLLQAQDCPPNIDFEKGNFEGWTCYTGFVTGNGVNEIVLTPSGGPVPGQHTMYTSFPGDGVDPYGGFPVNCPNGSGHSIRLGNNYGGGEAEGISYEFTIPANQDYYTLIYNYAVVFQDPNHEEFQQPRMQIEITNVTDNKTIYCSSFTFIPYGTILPGFFESPTPGGETSVWCKDWTAVSINLDGHAGKKIRMFFKTADCTFQRHFGYAYIDVNSECSGTFVGATYCPDDAFVNVVAPYGYQGYRWFNNSFSQVLGYQQTLNFTPPPASGMTVAVELTPYAGYGCKDTLFATLIDTLRVVANAGRDTLSCNKSPVQIGIPPRPGLIYQWTPAAGLTSVSAANPHAIPDVTTTYILTVKNQGGGCVDRDTVTVFVSSIDTSLQLQGKAMYCIGSGDSAVLRVQPVSQIQWFKDNVPIPGAEQVAYKAIESGIYYARLTNDDGCVLTTRYQAISITSVPFPSVDPGIASQCLVGNRFVLSNESVNAVGVMQYIWDMGNSLRFTTKDVVYSYSQAGVYNVKMVVSSSAVCKDSAEFALTVYQNAIADFSADPVCVNLPLQVVNRTVDTMNTRVNYAWDFGNGNTSDLRDPPFQVYITPGNHTVTLSVNTDQCPDPWHKLIKNVVVDAPRPPLNYPVEYAVMNAPLPLQARDFGVSATWRPASWLNVTDSYSPVFTGAVDQLYTIDIKTISGCLTVDTQLVKVVEKAEVFVPTAFTPNGDGLNDYLRPVVFGVKEINYFRVFNRWGQVVYQSKNIMPGWDGKINGATQTTQVFVWMVEGKGVDGSIITKKGTVTLVR